MARRDQPNQGVELPDNRPPYVDPSIDQSKLTGAAAYRAGIMARRGPPKADLPLQQERPPIPNLASRPPKGHPGGTMADFAAAERAFSEPSAPIGGIVEEAPQRTQQRPQMPKHTPASLGLAPADQLPEQAKNDPAFIQGPGSEFASNQPGLAAKYGVVRSGKFIPPQRLGGTGKATLSPETVAGLEAVRRMQNSPPPVSGLDPDEEEARTVVENGLGGSAARVNNLAGDRSVKTPTAEERDEALKNAIDRMDAWEFNEWRQLMMRRILHSEEERELIEKRLKPLDLGELLAAGVIRQRIPIIPGKYEVTLQSFDGQIDLALKRLVMMESKSVNVSQEYYMDKHSFMSLAAGIYKINDTVYDDILDKDGVFDDELFLKKFNRIMKLPIHMLASIGVNLMWFEMRVRKLYSATAVGNG